jgi:hypothetical protein
VQCGADIHELAFVAGYVEVYHLRDVTMTTCSVVDAEVVVQPCVIMSTIQTCYAARWTVSNVHTSHHTPTRPELTSL